MCKGISILRARLRQELYEEFELASRVVSRGGDPELHFMYTDRVVQLPVMHDGQMQIYEWGNRGNKESRLPRTGWCRIESLEAGKWRWLKPEKVMIPADFGLEKGVWFQITEGLDGVVVHDEQERPHVYMLTQQASHYYETMTKHDRMPLLVNQEI
ncbi:hypothetical protein [Aeoliella mucimassa]|uniref:Uncharacterized protein n=1 Tax=Aeoliella mucimassa TaxID=2527972 RepID=A0A518AT31_9BACT|nr:hypothetical protein [Aeoliella mucimassa]QDU57894.1 hypothetical protein Pan181_41170 [Aeoliella mucimassa]